MFYSPHRKPTTGRHLSLFCALKHLYFRFLFQVKPLSRIMLFCCSNRSALLKDPLKRWEYDFFEESIEIEKTYLVGAIITLTDTSVYFPFLYKNFEKIK